MSEIIEEFVTCNGKKISLGAGTWSVETGQTKMGFYPVDITREYKEFSFCGDNGYVLFIKIDGSMIKRACIHNSHIDEFRIGTYFSRNDPTDKIISAITADDAHALHELLDKQMSHKKYFAYLVEEYEKEAKRKADEAAREANRPIVIVNGFWGTSVYR